MFYKATRVSAGVRWILLAETAYGSGTKVWPPYGAGGRRTVVFTVRGKRGWCSFWFFKNAVRRVPLLLIYGIVTIIVCPYVYSYIMLW